MCGIFGYLNYKYARTRQEIINILVSGLKRLEYRGYDSSGIAIDSDEEIKSTVGIKIIKKTGRVKELEDLIMSQTALNFNHVFNTHFGIAHTRWATHGEPNDINSHPQTSGLENDFVVVHNGIITNYVEIQKILISHGFYQTSQTDTELLVLLMKYFYDKSNKDSIVLTFVELTNMVLNLIDGAYAVLFKSRHFPNEVIAARKSSQMIIGIKRFQSDSKYDVPIIPCGSDTVKEHDVETRVLELYSDYIFDSSKGAEYIFASDASAIVEHTKRVIYLQDGDVAHIKDGHLYIRRDCLHQGVEPFVMEEAKILQMELQEIMKGSYKTFMEKEIFEQPESIFNTMRGRVNFYDKIVTLGGLQHHIRHIARCRRIVFVACGTSYYSCIAIRQLMEELTEIPIMIELASDLLDREMPVFRDDVCVFVSQSGETADTLNALRYCKKFGAILMGVTNVVGSTISRETDCGIHLNAGPEIGVASTKAYSSQIIALIMFAIVLGEDRLSKKLKIEEIIDCLQLLPSVVKQCLSLSNKVEKIAKKYLKTKSCLVIGRGNHSSTCLEGALKVKELSYIHSEGIQSGELKHGPLALVDENMLIIMVVTDCKVFSKTVNALQQIMARKAMPVIITDCKSSLEGVDGLDVLEIPHTIDCLQAIPAIIPLQLLSLHLATMRGFDVDCPRNLAKSITVE